MQIVQYSEIRNNKQTVTFLVVGNFFNVTLVAFWSSLLLEMVPVDIKNAFMFPSSEGFTHFFITFRVHSLPFTVLQNFLGLARASFGKKSPAIDKMEKWTIVPVLMMQYFQAKLKKK